MYLWHVPAFRWFFKFSIILFSYQSSLRLAFLLGVLYLYLGNFILWPGRIPLSPMRISKHTLHWLTPVDFFQSLPKGRVSRVSVSPRMKMVISVPITHWPGSSLNFFWGVIEVKNLITHMVLLFLSPFWINIMGYLSPVRNIRVHSDVIWPQMLLLGDKIRVDLLSLQSWMKKRYHLAAQLDFLAPPDTLCPNFKRTTFNGISSIKYYRVLQAGFPGLAPFHTIPPFHLHPPTHASKSRSGLEWDKDTV